MKNMLIDHLSEYTLNERKGYNSPAKHKQMWPFLTSLKPILYVFNTGTLKMNVISAIQAKKIYCDQGRSRAIPLALKFVKI